MALSARVHEAGSDSGHSASASSDCVTGPLALGGQVGQHETALRPAEL